MLVRRAVPGDALAIATVHVRSWQAAYPGLVPQSYLDDLTPQARLPLWDQTLGATCWPRRGVLVMETGSGQLVGFAGIGPTEDDDADPLRVGEVQTLYLHPQWWGDGRGSLLLGAAVAELARAGYTRATLWVLGTNARARRFYERHGWVPDGATKVHDWQAFVALDVRYRQHLDTSGRPSVSAP